MKNNMKDHNGVKADEVGYRKPPKSGQFKKGFSGNPLGRPKKPADFGPRLLRELDSKLIINENGKRKIITKSEGVVKQLLNKSLSGHHQSTRLLMPLYLRELEKAKEKEQNSLRYLNREVADMSDAELLAYILDDVRKATSPAQMAEMLVEVLQLLNLAKPELLLPLVSNNADAIQE
jgi:hypothetical protein